MSYSSSKNGMKQYSTWTLSPNTQKERSLCDDNEILHQVWVNKLLRMHKGSTTLQIYVGTNSLELGSKFDTISQRTKINSMNCKKKQYVRLHNLLWIIKVSLAPKTSPWCFPDSFVLFFIIESSLPATSSLFGFCTLLPDIVSCFSVKVDATFKLFIIFFMVRYLTSASTFCRKRLSSSDSSSLHFSPIVPVDSSLVARSCSSIRILPSLCSSSHFNRYNLFSKMSIFSVRLAIWSSLELDEFCSSEWPDEHESWNSRSTALAPAASLLHLVEPSSSGEELSFPISLNFSISARNAYLLWRVHRMQWHTPHFQ